jgi:branched-chain amino acid transport system permease protein
MDGWPTIANLPVGVLIAVVAAALIGLAALRLTGPYFALATLTATAIAERTMIVLGPLTGGEEGVFGIPRLLGSRINLYYLTWVLFGLSLIALILLARSRLGLVLRAVHGDEATCRAAGLNTTVYKVVGLMVSGGIAGLGGVLYAHQQLYINPHAFAVILSVTVIIMAYVGGLGSIWGPAVAAIGLTILTEVLREVGEFRLFVYTGLLIVIVFFMPGGLVAPLWRRMTGGRHG